MTRRARRTPRRRGCGPSRWPDRAVPGRNAAASRDWAGSHRRRSAPADPGPRCGSCVPAAARRRPAAAAVIASRQSDWSSAPLACHRCCQLSPGWVCSQDSTASTPSRRVCWLAGLSNVNGAASTLASTADRLASVAGHDDATGRGGNAASSCAPVGFTSPLFGVVTSVGGVLITCFAAGGHGSFSPNRVCRLSARYPGAGGAAGSRSRCRAWKASTPAITSSVTVTVTSDIQTLGMPPAGGAVRWLTWAA